MRLMDEFKDSTTGVYENNIVFTHFVKGTKHGKQGGKLKSHRL